MNMLEKIAEITGFAFREEDEIAMTLLQRMAAKIPLEIDENHPGFREAVIKAEQEVNAEGQLAIAALVKRILTPAPEKVLKIKSSPKGTRIKVAAATGIRYSFGPVWNSHVKAVRGPALAKACRAKLNHQALMHGVEGYEEMDQLELCKVLSQRI
jgi:hypothetical protein